MTYSFPNNTDLFICKVLCKVVSIRNSYANYLLLHKVSDCFKFIHNFFIFLASYFKTDYSVQCFQNVLILLCMSFLNNALQNL